MDSFMLGILLVALAIAAHYFKNRKTMQMLDKFPGPPGYPLIGNTIDFIRLKFNLHAAVEIWTKAYGGVFHVKLGMMPFVIVSNPEDLEILLSSSKTIQKAELYSLLHPWIGEGLLTSTGQKWHTRRKLLTPTFHFRILDQFVEVFNRCGDHFVQNLLQIKDTFNVHALLTLCTLDIICETAMGTKVDAQKDSTSPYVSAVHKAVISFHRRTMQPWLHPDPIFNMTEGGKDFNSALKVMHKYTEDVIAARRKERETNKKTESVKSGDDDLGVKKREAFLDHLLDANDSSNAQLNDDDIREEVDTFMFEGHDTTAAALSFILYNVAAYPEVQEKLVQEMNDIFGDSDRPATSQDIQSMKYAERVVKESLRLYPSVPLFARKLREDLPITGDYIIPAGCNVTVSCFQMGRDPKQWPNPEKFDPDRFLPENISGRHPYAYVPFSAGPRNCIGQKFAMMEMKATLSKVVRRCHFSLPSPDYKPRIEGQVILRAPDGVMLKVRPRT